MILHARVETLLSGSNHTSGVLSVWSWCIDRSPQESPGPSKAPSCELQAFPPDFTLPSYLLSQKPEIVKVTFDKRRLSPALSSHGLHLTCTSTQNKMFTVQLMEYHLLSNDEGNSILGDLS